MGTTSCYGLNLQSTWQEGPQSFLQPRALSPQHALEVVAGGPPNLESSNHCPFGSCGYFLQEPAILIWHNAVAGVGGGGGGGGGGGAGGRGGHGRAGEGAGGLEGAPQIGGFGGTRGLPPPPMLPGALLMTACKAWKIASRSEYNAFPGSVEQLETPCG